MRFRAWLLSFVYAVVGIAVSTWAQDAQPKPVPDASPGQSAQVPPVPAQPGSDPTQAQPAASQDQAPAAEDKDQPKNPEVKHDGGKNDVDAIGNRKVGGFDIYSPETDIKIGKAYAAQIEPSMKIVQDPVINEYVNRLGQNLFRNSDAKFPLTIKVVDDDTINAMALPGGFLYVNTGLILGADDEAELAGAMAHEIAHIALRHGTRQMTRANIAQILTIPIDVVVPMPVNVPGLVLPAIFLKFSRNFEEEADYYGVQYMYKAGYDPNGLVNYFEKIEALEKRKPGTLSKAFSTHPQTPDRVRKTQKEIATILPARERYVETTSEFDDVKGRVAVLEHRRKAAEASATKPVLRRTSDEASPRDKKDDDRPVLNRRDQ